MVRILLQKQNQKQNNIFYILCFTDELWKYL